MKKILYGLLSFFSLQLFAGELIKDAEIHKISSSNDGKSDNFWVYVTAGDGICNNKAIVFPRELSPTAEFHNRMFSLAITAFTTKNQKVKIYAIDSDDCKKASFIELSR